VGITFLGLEKVFTYLEVRSKPELYSQPLQALDWGKPKTVGLRQDKSQDFLEFGLF
jgi:hypothetical protein